MTDFLETLAVAPRIPEIEAPDDWRGEARIRSVPRVRSQFLASQSSPSWGNDQNGMSKLAEVRTCKAEGCEKKLERRNRIGYCKAHRHLWNRRRA